MTTTPTAKTARCGPSSSTAFSRRAAVLLAGLIPGSAASAMALAPASPGGGTPPPGSLLQLECEAANEATGVIGRTVALHTDGDGRLDLIAQVSDELIWVTGPDPLQHSSTLGIHGVTSFAALPKPGQLMSALVVVHGGGAELVERDLTERRAFVPVRTAIGGAEWVGARSVVTMDIDGDGDEDVVGLSADGTQLLRLDQTAPGAFVPGASLDLGAELSELRSIRWSGGSLALAAILHGATEAACVLGTDGHLLLVHPLAQPVDDLSAMAGTHSPGVDALVVLSGGALTVLRPGGVMEAPIDVGPLGSTSMSTVDLDGDGRCDVLLNSSSSDTVTVILGQDRASSPGTTLAAPSAASAITIPLEQDGASMAAQRANPVGADFDRDGDIDVFQLIESTRGACVQRNVLVDENSMRPVITGSEWIETPSGLLALLDVSAMTMPDGAAPDRLELTLSTALTGGGADDEEFLRLQAIHVVGSATSGAGNELVTLQIPGELGPHSSLLIRGYRDDFANDVIRAVGVEATYYLTLSEDALARGTDSGIDVTSGAESGNQGTPPPPPPKPIDPFG